MHYPFHRSIVGGTFDHFHVGHQTLLKTAFAQSEKVIIGIATSQLYQHKLFAGSIEDFKIREQSLIHFLEENDLTSRAEIVPIHDFYGTSLTDKSLEAIFITESNRANVEKMNSEREKRGFTPLKIIAVSYARGNDDEIIASGRIRQGISDRKGNAFLQLFTQQETFVLPETQRDAFRHPIGKISRDIEDVIVSYGQKNMLIAIGDVVSTSLLQHGRQADVSIIDGKTRRQAFVPTASFSSETERSAAISKAGTIEQQAVKIVHAAIQQYLQTQRKQLITITGEEDLLAIPAILLSPLHTVVLYGQFGKGIVVGEVTEETKKIADELFKKFLK